MFPFDSCARKTSYFPSLSLLVHLIASCRLLSWSYLFFASGVTVFFLCQFSDHPRDFAAGLLFTFNRCLLPQISFFASTIGIAGVPGTQTCKKKSF